MKRHPNCIIGMIRDITESYKLSFEHHQYISFLSSCVIYFYSASFGHDLVCKTISSPYPRTILFFSQLFGHHSIKKPEELAFWLSLLNEWTKEIKLILFLLAEQDLVQDNPVIAPARTAAVELSVPVFGSPGVCGCLGCTGCSRDFRGWIGTIGVGGVYGSWCWWNFCFPYHFVLMPFHSSFWFHRFSIWNNFQSRWSWSSGWNWASRLFRFFTWIFRNFHLWINGKTNKPSVVPLHLLHLLVNTRCPSNILSPAPP